MVDWFACGSLFNWHSSDWQFSLAMVEEVMSETRGGKLLKQLNEVQEMDSESAKEAYNRMSLEQQQRARTKHFNGTCICYTASGQGIGGTRNSGRNCVIANLPVHPRERWAKEGGVWKQSWQSK